MKRGFVSGISTDVGKTVASAVLTEALEADYGKPVRRVLINSVGFGGEAQIEQGGHTIARNEQAQSRQKAYSQMRPQRKFLQVSYL